MKAGLQYQLIDVLQISGTMINHISRLCSIRATTDAADSCSPMGCGGSRGIAQVHDHSTRLKLGGKVEVANASDRAYRAFRKCIRSDAD